MCWLWTSITASSVDFPASRIFTNHTTGDIEGVILVGDHRCRESHPWPDDTWPPSASGYCLTLPSPALCSPLISRRVSLFALPKFVLGQIVRYPQGCRSVRYSTILATSHGGSAKNFLDRATLQATERSTTRYQTAAKRQR